MDKMNKEGFAFSILHDVNPTSIFNKLEAQRVVEQVSLDLFSHTFWYRWIFRFKLKNRTKKWRKSSVHRLCHVKKNKSKCDHGLTNVKKLLPRQFFLEQARIYLSQRSQSRWRRTVLIQSSSTSSHLTASFYSSSSSCLPSSVIGNFFSLLLFDVFLIL